MLDVLSQKPMMNLPSIIGGVSQIISNLLPELIEAKLQAGFLLTKDAFHWRRVRRVDHYTATKWIDAFFSLEHSHLR